MVNDPQNATGRSRPAQCPIAPMASAEPPANVFEGSAVPVVLGNSEPTAVASPTADSGIPAATAPSIAASSPAPSAYAPSIGLTASRATITIPSGSAASSNESHTNSDEERTLLALLRLIDRLEGPGTLSTVERAFVAGAEIMFDQLSKECREMINRRPSDLTRSMAAPGLPAHSAGNSPYSQPAPAETPVSRPLKTRRKAKPKPPTTP